MRNLSSQILEHIAQLPEGTPICAKELLHLGTRAAVDQALSRLARSGKLMRSGHGLYVRPIETRFGTRAPAAEKVVSEIARLRGEIIVPSPAASANALGLTTQVPTRMIYLTSGRSRRMKLGAQTLEIKHAPRWQLTKAGESAGEVVRALAWLGPSHAREGLARLKQRVPKQVLEQVVAARGTLPEWLAKSVSAELVENG